jgi:replicative DNA helicase
VLGTYATALADENLQRLAESDLFWDVVTAIEADGTADVYDMSVPGTNNFIANGILCHNSIEQDSDLVMFIYRDEVYNPETENRGEAELILAKHRNGPTGVVRLAFMNQYTKFASIAKGPSF